VHIAYANQAQESFLEGHVRAFEILGDVPTGMIRYDNLKLAVIRVLLGRERRVVADVLERRRHFRGSSRAERVVAAANWTAVSAMDAASTRPGSHSVSWHQVTEELVFEAGSHGYR
jgi:hypothetical protein